MDGSGCGALAVIKLRLSADTGATILSAERPIEAVGSTVVVTHHSRSEKGWCDEAASSDILLGRTAGRDLGSMAARGVDEIERSRL